MKILGFYISRTDWEFLFNYERETLAKVVRLYNDLSEKTSTPRDSQGRFTSKQKNTTKQLRNEVAQKNTINWVYQSRSVKDGEFGR